MKRFLACLLLCVFLPVAAGQNRIAQKPILIVVKASWCRPCKNFAVVWDQSRELREALTDAFDMRELDWDLPGERAEAMRLGATAIPTFIALRGTRRIAVSEGYAATLDRAAVQQATAELMQDLGVEWPRVATQAQPLPDVVAPIPRPIPTPAGSSDAVDSVARDGVAKLIGQAADLQAVQEKTQSSVETLKADIGDVRAKIGDVSRSVEESSGAIAKQLKQSQEQTNAAIAQVAGEVRKSLDAKPGTTNPQLSKPTGKPDSFDWMFDESPKVPNVSPDISTEIKPGPTVSKWLSLAAWIGRTGVAIAAPEIAIPGSIGITLAGFALRWLTSRKGTGLRPGTFPGLQSRVSNAVAAGPTRDNSEVEQILSLRQQEQRDPIHDALFGVLFEDEYRSKPNQPIKEAWLSAMDRFNNIAPLSTQTKTVRAAVNN